MGQPVLNPHPEPAATGIPDDLTSFADMAAFMGLTGLNVNPRTWQRWAREDNLVMWLDPTDPRGRRRLASLSDLLESHRKRQVD
jgi:hypothetical protein